MRLAKPFLWVLLVLMASAASAQTDILLEWKDNLLKIRSPRMPCEWVELGYLEAFCRKDAHDRDWSETVLPHSTRLLGVADDGHLLELESDVDGKVRVRHQIRAVGDGVEFRLVIENLMGEALDVDWAQPYIRVDRFTGMKQEDYIRKSFLFTENGLTMLDQLPRAERARYRGGQVFVPKNINPADVNPRPLSAVTPANRLIGCFSEDGRWLLATAWEPTQELFQGVIVCLHNDFRIGGLAPRQTKNVFGKVYFIENKPALLLDLYRRDFPEKGDGPWRPE